LTGGRIIAIKLGGNSMSEISIYQSIALDIAQRISNGEFLENRKISGRTLLASQYRVSPETVRKAVVLLKEENIVEVSQGKEVIIISKINALNYINKYQYLKSVYSLKQGLAALLKEKKNIDNKFEELINDVASFSDRLRNLTPFNPLEIEITTSSHIVGKTIADLQFWQFTGATIIALRRGINITISPGPHVIIMEQDILVCVGDETAHQRVAAFIHTRAETTGEQSPDEQTNNE
jgi:K+/H+ antiporter YhaU regulatory subunit KhtT